MYIIWKDKYSLDISGLKILNFPPITKPQMRVKETTIDGLNGSIIEELGYESYDKTIRVGLVGAFDIDTVVSYFTGKGQLVFSNELDKVYEAQIIGQIDYEKLLRFRTADIRFRVQPFKYKFGEKATTLTGAGAVYNRGNMEAKPIITLVGSGTVEVSINDIPQFSYTFPEGEDTVIIDCEKEDAYLGAVLKNRHMNGEFPSLKVGSNSISFSGTVDSLTIEPKSRWL